WARAAGWRGPGAGAGTRPRAAGYRLRPGRARDVPDFQRRGEPALSLRGGRHAAAGNRRAAHRGADHRARAQADARPFRRGAVGRPGQDGRVRPRRHGRRAAGAAGRAFPGAGAGAGAAVHGRAASAAAGAARVVRCDHRIEPQPAKGPAHRHPRARTRRAAAQRDSRRNGALTQPKILSRRFQMAKHFINGQWVQAASGETLPVIDPSTGEVFEQLARGNAVDIDRAVAAARAALNGPWGRLTATERGRILLKMSDLILARTEELAQLEARDTGKPLSQARNDITVAARYCEFYGGAADKVHGQQIPYMNDFQVVVLREPYGVTAHILPWNYPAQMFGRSVVPALAMGNAAVLKPSEDACMTPLAFCEIAREAGLPAGALNVVTGLGEEAGAALTAHHDIDFVTFTGSPEVGTLVQKAAADRTLKCVLELGGKSPQIVFEDADQDRAATFVLK